MLEPLLTQFDVNMSHSFINMTFDLYDHLFENAEADRSTMEKSEAAVRV